MVDPESAHPDSISTMHEKENFKLCSVRTHSIVVDSIQAVFNQGVSFDVDWLLRSMNGEPRHEMPNTWQPPHRWILQLTLLYTSFSATPHASPDGAACWCYHHPLRHPVPGRVFPGSEELGAWRPLQSGIHLGC